MEVSKIEVKGPDFAKGERGSENAEKSSDEEESVKRRREGEERKKK